MRSRMLGPWTFIRVQTWSSRATASQEVEIARGTSWPKETGTIASSRAGILCLGPTDWLVTSTDSDAKTLRQQPEVAFEVVHSVQPTYLGRSYASKFRVPRHERFYSRAVP